MKNKLAIAGALVALSIVLVSGVAGAAPDSGVVTASTAAGTTLKDTLVAIGTAVMPFGAAVAAIGLGWRMVRKFVRA